MPNLASRILARCLSRLSADWQAAYDHPILLVESFVDSQLFRGTCYKAQGWTLLGATKGFERAQQDYYVAHDRPKQLWVRELDPGTNPKTNARVQLRALCSYLGHDGRYHAPKETTFQRVLGNLDPDAFERILHAWETQLLGPSETNGDHRTAIDGKAQCGSTPEVKNEQKPQLVSAQSLPSGRVLGTVFVEAKSNEIPAAREPLKKIGPSDGKLILLDALHTNQSTLRQIHQDNGADSLLPIKENHRASNSRGPRALPPRPRKKAARATKSAAYER